MAATNAGGGGNWFTNIGSQLSREIAAERAAEIDWWNQAYEPQTQGAYWPFRLKEGAVGPSGTKPAKPSNVGYERQLEKEGLTKKGKKKEPGGAGVPAQIPLSPGPNPFWTQTAYPRQMNLDVAGFLTALARRRQQEATENQSALLQALASLRQGR